MYNQGSFEFYWLYGLMTDKFSGCFLSWWGEGDVFDCSIMFVSVLIIWFPSESFQINIFSLPFQINWWQVPPQLVLRPLTLESRIMIILRRRLLAFGTWHLQLGISERIVFWVKEVSAEYIKGVLRITGFVSSWNSLFNFNSSPFSFPCRTLMESEYVCVLHGQWSD